MFVSVFSAALVSVPVFVSFFLTLLTLKDGTLESVRESLRRKEGRRKEEGGRRKEEGGRRKEEGGRRKEEGGRCKEEGER